MSPRRVSGGLLAAQTQVRPPLQYILGYFVCRQLDMSAPISVSPCYILPPITHTQTTGSKLRFQTPAKHTTNISEPLRIISVKYSSILPDDGSHTIRNMLQ